MTPNRRELAAKSMPSGRGVRQRTPRALPPGRGGDADAFRLADAATVATRSPAHLSVTPGHDPKRGPLGCGAPSTTPAEPPIRDDTGTEGTRWPRHRRLPHCNACSSSLPKSGDPPPAFDAHRFDEQPFAVGATGACKGSAWPPMNSLGLIAEACESILRDFRSVGIDCSERESIPIQL